MYGPRFQTALKALLLVGMGLFLYSRIANGTLYFYINQRFAGLTLLAVVGLVVVGISYRPRRSFSEYDHGDAHKHIHEHPHAHNHHLTWSGVVLVALPILLGVFVPPRPLGASALLNRDVTVGSSASAMPAAVRASVEKVGLEKNLLDWLHEFQAMPDPASFDGQEAQIIGFVFRDERFADDEFSVARFVVSCCAADASFAGLVVDWPDTAALENDQWVEVYGRFLARRFGDTVMPILMAERVVPTQMPNQPYLYP